MSGMDCNELVELVTDYLDDALPEDDRRRFEEHLEICEGCTNYVAQLVETIAITGSLSTDDIDPAMRERLLDAFRDFNSSG